MEDGEEAIAFLSRQGRHAGAPRPDLILLDIGMPRMNGHEGLAIVKQHPDWKRIPVDNGEEALEYLRRQGKYASAARPNLILLDLLLPRMSGHEVLAVVKDDGVLRRIPIVIMTSSTNEEEFRKAYHCTLTVACPSRRIKKSSCWRSRRSNSFG